MERNLDRKTLSFSKGMTNIPSDLLSDDTELVESDGFIYRDGEMKSVQKPTKIGNIPYKIMYVHKGADYENYVAIEEIKAEDDPDDYPYCNIHFYTSDGFEQVDVFTIPIAKSISSVGNTVMCATKYGIYYFLLKEKAYNLLGDHVPQITVTFRFEQFDKLDDKERTKLNLNGIIWTGKGTAWYDSDRNFISVGDKPSGGTYSSDYYYYKTLAQDSEKLTDFNNAVTGHIAEAINWVKSKNVFSFPFFVRYGLRLFDGSIASISAPILLYPSINRNTYIRRGTYLRASDSGYQKYNEDPVNDSCEFFYFIKYSEMLVELSNMKNLNDWMDIVKGVVIFASDQVLPFKIDGNWDFKEAKDVVGSIHFNSMYKSYQPSKMAYNEKKYTFKYNTAGDSISEAYCALSPTFKSDSEIIDELTQKSIYYKILEIDAKKAYQYEGEYHHTIDRPDFKDSYYTNKNLLKIKDGVIENLVLQEQLKDDYYGWTYMCPDKIFSYNNRANIIGTKRVIERYTPYCPLYEGGIQVDVYVYIQSATQTGWVNIGTNSITKYTFDSFFFFFHPDARRVVFYDNENKRYISKTLSTHPRLNGAYMFKNLPSAEEGQFTSGTLEDLGINTEDFVENLDSQIFTSVVNNPFVFEASGDNTIGTGKILEIAANTEPVSQGQFGQYPLLVFTSEGIYGMSVNSEGLYSASYPISREVCNDDSPMVPTDKLIFFVSKKGLMATSGGTVANMSELMRGRNPRNFADIQKESFLNFLNGCIIAYDYRDSLLRIYKNGYTYHYIYNMIDKTFGIVYDGINVQAVVNDYPDNIVQDTNGNIYTLIGKPEINDDENVYNGSLTTRPLKLGGSINLKSIRAVKNLLDTNDGKITLEIWGSNDCKHWQKLVSLGGKPWKYFTFKYSLSNFKATDSFAGSIVEIQTRRTDKIR